MNNTPMTRLENMTQFLLEYGVNPKKEPINTVLFHLKAAESELAEARESLIRCSTSHADLGLRMRSRIAEVEKQRDELSGHYHRLNAENVILQQQRDMLAEALQPFINGWSDKSCDSIVTEQQFRDAKQALAEVKGEKP
jgi:hypothetical protein